MTKLYIGDISALCNENCFKKYEAEIDHIRRKKLLQCRNQEDRMRSLLGGYLIQLGVKECLFEESGLQADAEPLSLTYIYGENGKPYLENYNHIYFSISHSGNYVVAAFSKREIGADIQEHRRVKAGLADRFFSGGDLQLMKITENKEEIYKIWSVKEAFMKLTGEGLQQGTDTTTVVPMGMEEALGTNSKKQVPERTGKKETQSWHKGSIKRVATDGKSEVGKKDSAYFRLYDTIKGYSIAVCSYEELSDIIIRKIEIS